MHTINKQFYDMRYFIRALKYFIYITILGTLLVILIAALQGVSLDINTLFVKGSDSVYTILGIFAAVSAIYPAIGYQKRSLSFNGDWNEIKPGIISLMNNCKFKLEHDTPGRLTFVSDGGITRFLRMYEDRITMDITGGVMLLEGHRRNLLRVMYEIEGYVKKLEEDKNSLPEG